MGSRLWLICLLLAMAVVAECSSHFHSEGITIGTCDPALGNCVGAADEMAMDSEVNHRLLAYSRRFISYNAMQRNSIPCNERGRSYYGCIKLKKANPYKRSCSAATNCLRYTD